MPSAVTHFYSGQPMHFCSGVDNRGVLETYGKACGWALARAHGRASHPWLVSGYLGTSDVFDKAMGDFAVAYADQTERDHAALKTAVRAGTIRVHIEEDR